MSTSSDRPGPRYYASTGGHPAQTELTTDRAVFTEAYAVLPRGTMRDIVTSKLPFWENTRLWVIARPLSGCSADISGLRRRLESKTILCRIPVGSEEEFVLFPKGREGFPSSPSCE
jgi:hypothetical protein